MPERDAAGRAPLSRRLQVGPSVDIGALYPELYYASLDSIAALPASQLVEAVMQARPGAVPVTSLGASDMGRGPYPSAQFVVSLDPPQRFDPELSTREPLELQVWPDGSLTVEIEFTGDDIRASPAAGDLLSKALAEWAAARSWQLDGVYNDRGRSLPDIWNARFIMLDTSASVGSAIEFAGRAIFVAESHRIGGNSVERLLAILRAGDAHALLGARATAVFQPRPGPPPMDEVSRFELASDVCAFANAVHGGLLVLGLELGGGGAGERVAAVRPFPLGGDVDRLAGIVRSLVFPEPADFAVEEVPVASAEPAAAAELADQGLIVIAVPPQDRALKPFLVHGMLIEGRYQAQFASIVERRDSTIYAQEIAALHAQIAAGSALLRRGPVAGED